MSQYDPGTIDPNTKDGASLATDLNNWRDALHSSHRGATAPGYASAGMLWIDDSASTTWELKFYDGADWISLFTIDTTNNDAWSERRSKVVTRSSAFTINTNDVAKLINCTATADYIISFDAAATLEDSFFCHIKNNSNYMITLDPNGAETINGETSFILNPQQHISIWCDGSNLFGLTENKNETQRHGECTLSYVSPTEIKLSPRNGNQIIIDGLSRTIPSSGITITNSGLSINTNYYVYAYINSGSIALELSITGHTTNSSDGIEIKSGDNTRTLTGLIRTNGSGNFEDSQYMRFVCSWFNQSARYSQRYGSNSPWTFTSITEIDSTRRIEAVTFSSNYMAVHNCVLRNNTIGQTIYAVFGHSGGQVGLLNGGHQDGGVNWQASGTNAVSRPLSEGHHYFQIMGLVSAGTGAHDISELSITFAGGPWL